MEITGVIMREHWGWESLFLLLFIGAKRMGFGNWAQHMGSFSLFGADEIGYDRSHGPFPTSLIFHSRVFAAGSICCTGLFSKSACFFFCYRLIVAWASHRDLHYDTMGAPYSWRVPQASKACSIQPQTVLSLKQPPYVFSTKKKT